MRHRRLLLALALGALLALALAGCSAGVRGSVAEAASSVAKATSGPLSGLAKGSATGKPNFLSTRGSQIVDSDGKPVTITGINWFGMETGIYAPHGLWSRNLDDMMDQIASLGFNTIRLPYSNQLFDPNSKVGQGVDPKLNPDLQGLTGVQMMDRIVQEAGKRGLKVILDQHRPDANGQSKLWYTDQYNEDRWISDWVALAQRYKGNDTVIGADLHNEPAGNAVYGSGDPKTDWRLAAERAGNAIQEVNPDWLIIVEGVEKANNGNDGYWMGGNLMDVAQYPVRLNVPNKLVYSAHDYGPGVYNQSWFMDKSFPANLPGIWDAHWAYLSKQGTAPVLIGEFGGRSVGSDVEGTWQRSLLQFMKDHSINYTYWSLNPNSGDTGGVLNDDWATANQDKMAMLSGYQAPMMRVGNPLQVDTSAVPGPRTGGKVADSGTAPEKAAAQGAGTTTPPPAANATQNGVAPAGGGPVASGPASGTNGLQLLYQAGNSDAHTNNPSPKIKLINTGTAPIRLGDLELRYWFDPDDQTGQTQLLDVDWASIGKEGVTGQFVKAGPNLDYLSITFKDQSRTLNPNDSLEMSLRIHKADWSLYDQSNDYSFSPDGGQHAWERIASYVGGKLTWGVEPQSR